MQASTLQFGSIASSFNQLGEYADSPGMQNSLAISSVAVFLSVANNHYAYLQWTVRLHWTQ